MDGKTVASNVMESHQEDEHCDRESVTILRVGWPLGTASDGRTARHYVRDPDGILVEETLANYQQDVALPPAARDTGFSSEIGELWLVPDDRRPEVAYIVTDEGVEAWPRTRQLLGCD